MIAGILAMMVAMKIHLYVTTATVQALPCAGTAASVSGQIRLAAVLFLVLTDLMNLILIPVAIIAQGRALYPAQVFLGTVQRCATAMPRAQTDGMSFFPLAHLLLHNLTRPMILSVVRRPASIRARTDPCVLIVGRFAIMSWIVQMGAKRTLLLARTTVSHMPMRVILSTDVTMIVAFSGD